MTDSATAKKAKARAKTKKPAEPKPALPEITIEDIGDPKLKFIYEGLTKMGQQFTQAAKSFADANGASVFVRITLIPTLKQGE